MGSTKMQFYTEHQIEMARTFKSLGHPARVAIIEKLMTNEKLNVSDLRFYIPLAQSTISKHLKELYNAGVIGYNVIGNNSYYYINPEVLSELVIYLKKINIEFLKDPPKKFIYYKQRLKINKPFFMRV